ncbi:MULTISPECIES: hypothetical protein [unclassified Mesorhizobium]|uniref:hypothetical protein n=1 Tax=unclassified Mesorhizobium TaxID=325217 RepID=UPI000FD9EC41|nr:MULTISPECIES: hypothetical protein [unclassified Mesorhizobium]TGQ09002.1 hypothetical protein EN862_022485 [Mesorhizobium sp. M2E.F.Ca.ET.219.01.1.1]TGT69537.1 hypothetical protein EN809_024765 [Mesorhizobium sp. M2E.F.Ca.ET.166.01.1.1]TGW01869.1 hypothetical protein EN797_016260 [Mesorhizobium sp. M2E.F.Ca.ET.154.01.1.1]
MKGVDLAAIDPLEVLRSIAADTSAPANARLQAARTLLAHGGRDEEEGDQTELDAVSQRALRILQGGRK